MRPSLYSVVGVAWFGLAVIEVNCRLEWGQAPWCELAGEVDVSLALGPCP